MLPMAGDASPDDLFLSSLPVMAQAGRAMCWKNELFQMIAPPVAAMHDEP